MIPATTPVPAGQGMHVMLLLQDRTRTATHASLYAVAARIASLYFESIQNIFTVLICWLGKEPVVVTMPSGGAQRIKDKTIVVIKK